MIPEFRRTSFVDYQLLKFIEHEGVRGRKKVEEICDTMYWAQNENIENEVNYVYEYSLTNQDPFPYQKCFEDNHSEMCRLTNPIVSVK